MNLSHLIEQCRTVDLSLDDSYDRMYSLFTSHATIPSFVLSIKNKGFVVRSRTLPSGKAFTKVIELMNPPNSCVTAYSRANKPGQSLFYCSDNYKTTFAELMPVWLSSVNEGQPFDVTLSFWQIENPLLIAIIPDPGNPRMLDLFKAIEPLLQSAEDRLYWDYINSFFAAQGFGNPSVYKFTSAYCNAIFDLSNHNNSPIDGILYTSVQDKIGWNIALVPSAIKRCLQLSDISQHHFVKLKGGGAKPQYQETYAPVAPKTIDNSNGLIVW
jgi:hypothetical protein